MTLIWTQMPELFSNSCDHVINPIALATGVSYCLWNGTQVIHQGKENGWVPTKPGFPSSLTFELHSSQGQMRWCRNVYSKQASDSNKGPTKSASRWRLTLDMRWDHTYSHRFTNFCLQNTMHWLLSRLLQTKFYQNCQQELSVKFQSSIYILTLFVCPFL